MGRCLWGCTESDMTEATQQQQQQQQQEQKCNQSTKKHYDDHETSVKMVLLGVTWDLEPYSQWKFLRACVFETVLQNQQAPGEGEGQGSVACYSPWDMTE